MAKDSTKTSHAKEKERASPTRLDYRDLEKIDAYGFSPEADTYLRKKGFNMQADTVIPGARKKVFSSPEQDELVELVRSQTPEGTRVFVINYFIESEAAYEKFIGSLRAGTYKYQSRFSRFERSPGTYEELYIYSRGESPKNGAMYFLVEYFHRLGKELSEPAM